MKKLNPSFKIIVIIAVFVILLTGGGLIYLLFFQQEVDSVALNGPLEVKIISLNMQLPLQEQIQLAAGIAYDNDNGRFFISTDEPHTLFTKHEAYIYVLNTNLNKIETTIKLIPDGDLEGITYIGENTIAVASELGTLLYLHDEGGNKFVEQKRVSIFSDGQDHKLGSLAYDTSNQHLYTAEKEGKKTIYKLNREGTLLDSFEPQLADHIISKRAYSLDTDYTIAGMTYADGYLYIFSEAYSTIFKFRITTQKVEEVIGVDQLPEAAGITVKDNQFYFVGDFEDYLPAPQIHIASKPGS
jgi:uncharacterized protein YjiK